VSSFLVFYDGDMRQVDADGFRVFADGLAVTFYNKKFFASHEDVAHIRATSRLVIQKGAKLLSRAGAEVTA
jgi:hypothetical protein